MPLAQRRAEPQHDRSKRMRQMLVCANYAASVEEKQPKTDV